MPASFLPSAVDLARAQFAFTVVWHFLFPSFTIGLASYLAVLEGLWLGTGEARYLDTFRYWLKVFALVFAMGVVSGLVMSYELGTNWSVFSDRTAPILGPLLGYEVLSAFFLEAGFLGVMLFGMERVGPRLHFAATCLVAGGTLVSAFWILSANSWMQTPAGHVLGPDGRFAPADWWALIFNPSFPYRLAHTVTASYLTTAMIVGAVGAWHLLRDCANPRARLMFSIALWMAAIVAPVQLVIGDLHGGNTYHHQPAKVAAMEGHFETRRRAPAIVLGWPDAGAGETRGAIEIPGLASLYLAHDLDGEVIGLKDLPRDTWPTNLPLVFWSFRVMVGLGVLMIALGLTSLWLRGTGRLYETRWFQRCAVAMGPSGLVAVTAGWVVTEAGRQPFTVYGLLRTAESVSPIAAPAVATSLAAFAVIYFTVFGAGIWHLLHLFNQTPQAHESGPPPAPSCPRSKAMSLDLTLVWAVLIATAVLLYIVMDGFDLGIGILFLAVPGKADRDVMVNTVAPVWDGNETWLIFGGGGLFAVFPLAYATLLPALYMPLIVMVLALVFRGVAFEMRFRAASRRTQTAWDLAFSGGSYTAAFCQGLCLGALVQGVRVEGRAYAGGWWDWLTPFSVLTGLALVAGYGLLGACWLIWKTEGELQVRAYRLAQRLGLTTLAAIALVSAIMPLLSAAFRDRWLTFPAMALAAPVPLLVGLLAWRFLRALDRREEVAPFLCALGLFGLSYLGLGISLFPTIVPPSVTIWDAATHPSSQLFLLVGTVVLLPLVLAYTGYAYWVFRGKVGPGGGYH